MKRENKIKSTVSDLDKCRLEEREIFIFIDVLSRVDVSEYYP